MTRWEPWLFALRDAFPRPRPAPLESALRETMDWMYRAQDAGEDRGLSHSYGLGRGWAPSYPETTGYAIPTLLNWSARRGDEEARRRALEMGTWESAVQLPGGGIQASVVGRESGPVVFNTGQVLFGWVAAHRETGDPAFLASAERGARWLAETLGEADTWTSHGSMGESRSHTYNVRTTWAVLEYLRISPDPGMLAAMRRTLDWALSEEREPGWFDHNCLTEEERPLLHTISYTSQGLLESGVLLEDARCIEAARRTADALLAVQEPNGRLAGRYDRRFRPAADWACLTGIAQSAIVWHRLHRITGHAPYADAARRAGEYLRRVQRFGIRHPGVRGGVAGSYPVGGRYLRYRYPNWAAKFTLDAYLLEAYPDLADSPDYRAG